MSAMNIPARTRYRRRVGGFGNIDVKHDESVLDFSTAASCYNFDLTSGALRDGYGIAEHPMIKDGARRFWVFRGYCSKHKQIEDQYVYQNGNGLLKYYDLNSKTTHYISGMQYPPLDMLNYRLNSEDVLIMSCDGRKLYTWNGSIISEHKESPTVSSMALHYERLFVTSRDEPTKVFFSDNLDPTNWNMSSSEGGFIELLDERGDLNKVVSFGSYLYIFRDHGISRVTAFADQSEFAVVNLFTSAGRIFPSSIAKCGSVMMFLASDGLYVFDGYECSRVLHGLDGLILPDDNCASAYFNGKYFLSCRMSFGDGATVGCESGEYKANAMLVYDTATGEYSITRGLDINFMNACSLVDEDVLMACDGQKCGVIVKNGSRFDEPLAKHWQGPLTDLGSPDKTKTVREVYVGSTVDCVVSLSSGEKKKSAAVKRGNRRVRFNINAKRLALTVQTDAVGCNISPPTLIYTTT